MGVNQVARSAGFSLGSTLSALVLAARTPAGAVFPVSAGRGRRRHRRRARYRPDPAENGRHHR